MSGKEKPARLIEIQERALREMRELAESPELAGGTVGAVVFDLLRAGRQVSAASIVASLEAVASGTHTIFGLSDGLAKGALKVISDLQQRQAGQ